MSDGLRPGVSASRGWVWVLAGGTGMALLATYPWLEDALWWVFTTLVVFVWGLPYAQLIALLLLIVVLAAAVVWIWRKRIR